MRLLLRLQTGFVGPRYPEATIEAISGLVNWLPTCPASRPTSRLSDGAAVGLRLTLSLRLTKAAKSATRDASASLADTWGTDSACGPKLLVRLSAALFPPPLSPFRAPRGPPLRFGFPRQSLITSPARSPYVCRA